jgi:phytoene synthase
LTQQIAVYEPSLESAYAECRAIARREAKNFYYSFVALPGPRRNAICAIYAFMRKADDLSDDESVSREERRRWIDAWLKEWHAVTRGAETTDPVFIAVRDAIRRFNIPLSLLDELVAGTTMDLEQTGDKVDTYATFADLYRYCYLAEETGIAFQLTNILRDVTEDAERNRVYLPLDALAQHNVPLESVLHRPPGAPPTTNERTLLAELAQQAENYYASAKKLLPLIDKESRPALWVLVSIYHGLLKRIRHANYDVFSRRASVPTAHKLAILGVGMARMAWARTFA